MNERSAQTDAPKPDVYTSCRNWQAHRPWEHMAGEPAISAPTANDDELLVERIRAAYRKAITRNEGDQENFWLKLYSPLKRPIHDALLAHDPSSSRDLLRHPAKTNHFYGFDPLVQDIDYSEAAQLLMARHCYDSLRRLAEAVGAERIEQPETYRFDAAPPDPPETEALLSAIDTRMGFKLSFPNPYPGELGLATTRGVASIRAIHAIYQAWRVKRITKDISSPKVVEIGGGLGRTCYYAACLGISDYTIVDIPMSAAAQGYFLGSVLGPDAVSLYGERRGKVVKLIPPEAFFGAAERYDIAVNVDSFPELECGTTSRYLRVLSKLVSVLLSINHECLPVMVHELAGQFAPSSYERFPYWMRRGYIEEIFSWERGIFRARARAWGAKSRIFSSRG